MELVNFLQARQSWEAYLNSRSVMGHLEGGAPDPAARAGQPSGALRVRLHPSDHRLALEAGLGAMRADDPAVPPGPEDPEGRGCFVEIGLDRLAGGLDHLNADFHILLGDLLWKHEMERESLVAALQEVRVEEFESQARAYRKRAERAYFNGWYQEALNDFLEAEKRNYPDFSVQRSIASIYLYHVVDLDRALEYFSKAAKYAQPCDASQAAEAHYFAGVVCAIQNRLREALERMDSSLALNPHLYEARYQKACLAALLGETAMALESLKMAIKGDPRYYERTRHSRAFDGARRQVEALLGEQIELVQDRFAALKEEAELLSPYVIARPEKRENITALLRQIEAQLAEAHTYQSVTSVMETVTVTQTELRSIYDLFFKKHEMEAYDYIRSIAFSPDGRLLATGFLCEGIKVWEVDSAIKTRWLKGHTSRVNSLAFSPYNDWLASGSRDRTVRLWDIEGGRELRALEKHDSEVRAVVFSPDGEWLASGGNDRTARLWRVVTGNEVQTFTGHSHYVTSVAFSPDGVILATGSLDTRVKLWDVATGREVQTLAGHTKGVESIAFSPDGRWLASGGADKLVRIWDMGTGRESQVLSGHWGVITSVAFSPNGDLVVAGTLGRTVRIWKLATGQEIKTLWHPDISYNPVAFSPKGHWLAFGNHQIQLWLKTVLTEEQYDEVKAGEERALLMKLEAEANALERAGIRWLDDENDSAEEAALAARRRTKGKCRVCKTPLTFLERFTRKRYCRLHR